MERSKRAAVRHKVSNTFAVIELGPDGRNAVLNLPITDLSALGAYLKSRTLSARYEVGALLRMIVFMPTLGAVPARLEARVARRDESGLGVAFATPLGLDIARFS
jgi:hypothetical protein